MTVHAYWEGDDVPQPGDDDDAGQREEEELPGAAEPSAAGADAEGARPASEEKAEIERLFPFRAASSGPRRCPDRAEPSPGGEVAAEEEPAPAELAEPVDLTPAAEAEPREKEEPPEEIAAQGESLVTTPVTPYPVPEAVEPARKKARRHKGTPIRKKKAKKSKGRKRKARKPSKKARSARTVSSS